jgi:HlyD family secretion protein
MRMKQTITWAVAVLAIGGGAAAWWILSKPDLPPGFAGGNGRLEATEIYVATKYAGRVNEVLVKEGDTVEGGQIVARMDTSALDAQLRQAEADITAAEDARDVALAQVQVKKADHEFAKQQYDRSKELVTQGAVSEQEAQLDAARMAATNAELIGAEAQAVRTFPRSTPPRPLPIASGQRSRTASSSRRSERVCKRVWRSPEKC